MTQDLTVSPRGDVSAPVAAVSETAATLSAILRAAADPKTDVEKIERLMAMHERLKAQQAKEEFNRAMKACQADMKPVFRDAENPHTRSRYARLESIDAAIKPVYTAYGFSLSFSEIPEQGDSDNIVIRCNVMHDAGHSEPYALRGGLDTTGAKGTSTKTSIQGLGSTISYLRRYLKLMIFDVTLVSEDNDGSGGLRGTLTKQEVASLQDFLNQAADPALAESKFLGYMKQKALADIPRADYQRAFNFLRDKARQKAERAQQRAQQGPPADLFDYKEWPENLPSEPDWLRVAGKVYKRGDTGYQEWKA